GRRGRDPPGDPDRRGSRRLGPGRGQRRRRGPGRRGRAAGGPPPPRRPRRGRDRGRDPPARPRRRLPRPHRAHVGPTPSHASPPPAGPHAPEEPLMTTTTTIPASLARGAASPSPPRRALRGRPVRDAVLLAWRTYVHHLRVPSLIVFPLVTPMIFLL